MATAIQKWIANQMITLADMQLLISAPSDQQLWFEEQHWNPSVPQDSGESILAYTKAYHYDDDENSYTHAYTIRADGSDNTLIAENKDQPVWDFTGTKLSFHDNSYFDTESQTLKEIKITDIHNEVSVPAISPMHPHLLCTCFSAC